MNEKVADRGRITLDVNGRIVVGTDCSDRARRALNWAAETAELRNLPLVVVMAIRKFETGSKSSDFSKSLADEFKKRSQQELSKQTDSLRKDYPDVDIQSELVEGYPSYVLARASKQAALVVVGARGQSAPLSVRMLGGVSDAVVNHSHGPIAVITDEAIENPHGPVFLGVDDSSEAKTAAELAFEAAERRGVPLVAIHAWDYAMLGTPWEYDIWNAGMSDIIAEFTAPINKMLTEIQKKHPSVKVDLRVVDSSPAQALVDASNEACLVVVGCRGRGGFKGLLLGSTSKRVLREAHCPVTITRAVEHLEKTSI